MVLLNLHTKLSSAGHNTNVPLKPVNFGAPVTNILATSADSIHYVHEPERLSLSQRTGCQTFLRK